jgi:hypothetical protein
MWIAVGSIGSAFSALVAALAAYQARSAAKTMVAIEEQRYHHELTPKFRIRCTSGVPQDGFARLFVSLVGGELEAFDSVQVTILNTVDIRPWGLPEGVSQADAEAVLWAGWKFNTFFGPAAAHDLSSRQSRPRMYSRASGKDWEELLLWETHPASWDKMTPEEWRAKWREIPLRLRIECRRSDSKHPWVVNYNVEVEHLEAGGTTKPIASGGDLRLQDDQGDE